MEEKKLNDDVRTFVALFVEFDEMGFSPTTTCTNPEEYARDWKMAMLNKVHRLQDENKQWKKKVVQCLRDMKLEVGIRDKEIERLTERLDYFQKSSDYHEGNQKELETKNAELQKQVDELKKQFLSTCENCHLKKDIELLSYQKQQAVKDTAKEIIKWIKLNGTLGYGGYVIHDSAIEQICRKYGVGVE